MGANNMNSRLKHEANIVESRYDTGVKKSDIKRTFVDGKFNKENWMGGDAQSFRFFALKAFDVNKQTNSFEYVDEDDIVKLVVSRSCTWHNDYYYSTISVFEWTAKWLVTSVYTMVVYKYRGRIEEIKKNGEWITEEEFVKLLDDITKAGENIWTNEDVKSV